MIYLICPDVWTCILHLTPCRFCAVFCALHGYLASCTLCYAGLCLYLDISCVLNLVSCMNGVFYLLPRAVCFAAFTGAGVAVVAAAFFSFASHHCRVFGNGRSVRTHTRFHVLFLLIPLTHNNGSRAYILTLIVVHIPHIQQLHIPHIQQQTLTHLQQPLHARTFSHRISFTYRTCNAHAHSVTRFVCANSIHTNVFSRAWLEHIHTRVVNRK